jgi:hypothetical protein
MRVFAQARDLSKDFRRRVSVMSAVPSVAGISAIAHTASLRSENTAAANSCGDSFIPMRNRHEGTRKKGESERGERRIYIDNDNNNNEDEEEGYFSASSRGVDKKIFVSSGTRGPIVSETDHNRADTRLPNEPEAQTRKRADSE